LQVPASPRSDIIHIASESPIHIAGIRTCKRISGRTRIYRQKAEYGGTDVSQAQGPGNFVEAIAQLEEVPAEALHLRFLK
jgi:hypothetical protein